MPLLVQLKWSEHQMNRRWESTRYLHETSRDKCLLPEINQQKYNKNNVSYTVNVESNNHFISRLFIQEQDIEESVRLIEAN